MSRDPKMRLTHHTGNWVSVLNAGFTYKRFQSASPLENQEKSYSFVFLTVVIRQRW